MAEKRVEINKKISNTGAYIIDYAFTDIWESEAIGAGLSEETVEKYHAFKNSLKKDIGHISCDTVTDEYIVECGYNIIKS